MAKKPTDLTTGKDTEIEEGEGSGEIDITESTYAKFEREHGFDFSRMSKNEIQAIIQEYTQEGKLKKGAKVYNLKGELISHKAKKTQTKTGGRTYQVKESHDEPMTREAFEKEKADRDYKESSEKQDRPVPEKPFNPTPKGPGA